MSSNGYINSLLKNRSRPFDKNIVDFENDDIEHVCSRKGILFINGRIKESWLPSVHFMILTFYPSGKIELIRGDKWLGRFGGKAAETYLVRERQALCNSLLPSNIHAICFYKSYAQTYLSATPQDDWECNEGRSIFNIAQFPKGYAELTDPDKYSALLQGHLDDVEEDESSIWIPQSTFDTLRGYVREHWVGRGFLYIRPEYAQ